MSGSIVIRGAEYDRIFVDDLLRQNTGLPDSTNCRTAKSCLGLECEDCPLANPEVLLGDIREAVVAIVHPRKAHPIRVRVPEVPPEPEDSDVKSPSHYMLFDGLESIEVIARTMSVAEFRGFCLGNVLKYRLRAGKKSELATMEKDLSKAEFYKELFDKHKGLCYDAS